MRKAADYIANILEVMAWMMLAGASRVYHIAGRHMECSRLANYADAADQIDKMHRFMWLEHQKAKARRQN